MVNRILRLECEKLYGKSSSSDYKKKYRPSHYYSATLGIIEASFQPFIKTGLVVLLDDNFGKADLANLFSLSKLLDFNDGLIVKSIEATGAKLVTHDADFTVVKTHIPIVTFNNRI